MTTLLIQLNEHSRSLHTISGGTFLFSCVNMSCVSISKVCLVPIYIIKLVILSHVMFCAIRKETKECQVIDVFMQKGSIAKLKSR